jgi:hypothetical protein
LAIARSIGSQQRHITRKRLLRVGIKLAGPRRRMTQHQCAPASSFGQPMNSHAPRTIAEYHIDLWYRYWFVRL